MPELVTYWDYTLRVNEVYNANDDWRYGQAAFNALHDMRPDLAEQVRGSALDPFHVDAGDLGAFFEWVWENWWDDGDDA